MRDSVCTVVRLRLVYLARLREAFSSVGETLELPAHDAATVATVVATLRARGGAFASELAPGRAVRFAVNQRLVRAEHPLADGDEVAIFPPVTGG
ncbi:MAG TPA: MoaD/ThiS family protein [Casimicrobiaceae bacterium]|jgi:molybdopterin synthase sulfur carrier subunit|nr:MoaD/ThiS family protein [Casimicrobiaceae bacterium]